MGVDTYSCVGFPRPDAELLAELAEDAVLRLPAASGREFAIWRSPTGPSLWYLLDPAGDDGTREVVDVAAFFEGSSDVATTIRATSCDHGGCWTIDPFDRTGAPLVVAAVDHAARAVTTANFAVGLRLVLFADDVEVMNPQTAHMFRAAEPERADVTAAMIEHHRLINEATDVAFHWLSVTVAGHTLDVVAANGAIVADLAPGCTVRASGRLTARMLGARTP